MPDDAPKLRIQDVAALLMCSQESVRRWRKRPVDPLPAAQLGPRLIRYTRADVLAWAARQKPAGPEADRP